MSVSSKSTLFTDKKTVKEKMENVYSSIRPFYIYMKILGAFPVSVNRPSEKESSLQSFFNVFTSSCSIFIFIFLFCVNLFRGLTQFSGYSAQFINTIWHASLFIYLITMFFTTCYQISKRHAIRNFLRLLDSFDRKVKLFIFKELWILTRF